MEDADTREGAVCFYEFVICDLALRASRCLWVAGSKKPSKCLSDGSTKQLLSCHPAFVYNPLAGGHTRTGRRLILLLLLSLLE